MVEVLLIEFEHRLYLNVRVDVDLSLMGRWNLDISNQTHSDENCPFGHNFAELSGLLVGLQVVRRSSDHWRQRGLKLYDFIFKESVSNLVSSYFSKLVNCCDFLLLYVEPDLNMAAIVLRRPCVLRSTNDLERISHVRRDKQLFWNHF